MILTTTPLMGMGVPTLDERVAGLHCLYHFHGLQDSHGVRS